MGGLGVWQTQTRDVLSSAHHRGTAVQTCQRGVCDVTRGNAAVTEMPRLTGKWRVSCAHDHRTRRVRAMPTGDCR